MCIGEALEKLEPLNFADGCEKWYSCFGKALRCLMDLNIELPCAQQLLLLVHKENGNRLKNFKKKKKQIQ